MDDPSKKDVASHSGGQGVESIPTSRCLVFVSIAAAGLIADLVTKRLVFAWLGMPDRDGRTWWLFHGVLGFQTSLNEDALFGMGQGGWIIFALLSSIAVVGILWWLFWNGAARQWTLTIALASVMGGILGNLYDRLALHDLAWNYANSLHRIGEPVHAVRDWILVMIGRWPWPTFNIADSMLVCGAALLLWHAFTTAPETAS